MVQLISHVTCSLKPLKVGTWTNSSRFQARNGFCHRCHWLCGSNPPPAIDGEGGRVNEFHTAFWLRLEAKRDGNCIVLFVALCEATGHNAWHGMLNTLAWPSDVRKVKVLVRLRGHDTAKINQSLDDYPNK